MMISYTNSLSTNINLEGFNIEKLMSIIIESKFLPN